MDGIVDSGRHVQRLKTGPRGKLHFATAYFPSLRNSATPS
jgi:hypothetical protein